MLVKSLKFVVLGLTGAIVLNTVTPSISPAKDLPKTTVCKSAQSIWEQLNLTKEQKGKLQTIRMKRTNAISKVLNKDQKATFDKLRGKKKLVDILKELKLDANQQKAATAANQQAAKDIIAVLTPAQKQQLNDRKEAAE